MRRPISIRFPAAGGGNGGTIIGDAGNNFLIGTAGNDTINGLGGNDTIDGGPGDDTALFSGSPRQLHGRRPRLAHHALGAGRQRHAAQRRAPALRRRHRAPQRRLGAVRHAVLHARQSGRVSRRRGCARALQCERLARGPRSRPVFLQHALPRRQRGRARVGGQSADALRADRLEGRARSRAELRREALSGEQSRRRGGRRRSAGALPAASARRKAVRLTVRSARLAVGLRRRILSVPQSGRGGGRRRTRCSTSTTYGWHEGRNPNAWFDTRAIFRTTPTWRRPARTRCSTTWRSAGKKGAIRPPASTR